MIAHERSGRGERVVLVHGFGQDRRAWGPFGAQLAERFELVAIDAPGHGGSRELRVSVEESAALLAPFGPAVWIGYSMGARLALRLALDRPEAVRRLVLIGGTAGLEDPAARAARRAEDEALARELERDGCAAFFERWLARPMFAGLSEAHRFRALREAQDPRALAESLRRAGTGAMTPLWDRLPELRAPLLALAGARDARFVAEGERMAALAGGRFSRVEGAGHAAHLEAPERCLALVLEGA